jgi:hypothetical protein
MRALVPVFALALMALPACSKELQAPTDTGVCWHMAQLPDGRVRFNKVAQNAPSIEHCAVDLDAMRLRFLGLGGSQENIMGAYQGQFLFLGNQGVFVSQHLNGGRYVLLVPTGDGRLVKPGAMPVQ